jgi:hypothetical protein
VRPRSCCFSITVAPSNSGSLAKFTAMQRASSLVSGLTTVRRPGRLWHSGVVLWCGLPAYGVSPPDDLVRRYKVNAASYAPRRFPLSGHYRFINSSILVSAALSLPATPELPFHVGKTKNLATPHREAGTDCI